MAVNAGILFVGIGNMGLAAVLALLKSGSAVTVWNRTITRPQVKTAVEAGAVLEEDLSKAIATHSTIFICLLDYDKIYQSFENINPSSMLTGKTVVNLTNGTPKQASEMQMWCRERQVERYFDAAIMVTPQMVGGPHSFLVASGEDSLSFAAPAKLLSSIGKAQYMGPDVTAAARFDLAALSTMYGMFAGSFVGMALLKRSPSQKSIGDAVRNDIVPFLTALVPYLGLIADAWDEERWTDNMGSPVAMQLEGLKNLAAACEDEGVGTIFVPELAALMKRVVKMHGGDAGVAGVGALLLRE